MESGEDERVGLRLRGLGYSRAWLRMVKAVAAWAGSARTSVARGQKVACLGKGARRVRVRGQTGLPLGRMLPARARAGTIPCPGRHAFDHGALPGHAPYAQRSGHMTIAGSRHRLICPAWHIFDHGTGPRDRAGGRFRRHIGHVRHHIGRFQRLRLPDARMKIFGSSRYRAANSGIL